MARLYANTSGELVRVLASDGDERIYGMPSEYSDMLEFDPETNPELLAAIAASHNSHRLIGGVLTRDGVPVSINQPGPLAVSVPDATRFKTDLDGAIDTLSAGLAQWGVLTTNTKKQEFIINNFGTLLRINLGLLQFIRWLIRFMGGRLGASL